MSDLRVYLARAMDERPTCEIEAEEDRYTSLLRPLGVQLVNPFEGKRPVVLDDSCDTADRDLQLLRSTDLLLADLSQADYTYVGALCELSFARFLDLPIVTVVGNTRLHERHFLQSFSEFLCSNEAEAVEYIRAVHTKAGSAELLAQMREYYSAIAHCYYESWARASQPAELEILKADRDALQNVLRRYARGDVCELGVGTGDWTETICEVAESVWGLEQSREMLEQAQHRVKRFANVELIRCDLLEPDAMEETRHPSTVDCVVVYFLLGLFPRRLQMELLQRIRRRLRGGGLVIVADAKRVRNAPSMGLGRARLQDRVAQDRTFRLYKDHFPGNTLAALLSKAEYRIVSCGNDLTWFSWVVAAT
jgi:ubiquinone/menaquinone biosynthesis C-methylase UbiE